MLEPDSEDRAGNRGDSVANPQAARASCPQKCAQAVRVAHVGRLANLAFTKVGPLRVPDGRIGALARCRKVGCLWQRRRSRPGLVGDR